MNLLEYLKSFPKLTLANFVLIVSTLVGLGSWSLSRYEQLRDYRRELDERWAWEYEQIYKLRTWTYCANFPDDQYSKDWKLHHRWDEMGD